MARRKESLMCTVLGASSSFGNVHTTLLPKLRPIVNFQTPRNYEGIDNHMQTLCTYQAVFSLLLDKTLRTRLIRGIASFQWPCSQTTAKLFVTHSMINNGRYSLGYHMM